MSAQGDDFVIGADLSLLKRNMDAGAIYRSKGRAVDPVSYFRQNGFTWARLRLFNEPTGHGAQCNDLPYTLALARQLKAAGFKFLLDIHYSDTWADPGKQYTPKAWVGLEFEELDKKVYEYTVNVVSTFAAQGANPDMVQVGNEIPSGMLWEYGRIAAAHDTNTAHWQEIAVSNKDAWGRFARLLKTGIQGVHDAAGRDTQIMIHIDRGGDMATNRWFFDNLLAQGVAFDAIGESYYPFWHGMPEALAKTLAFLGERYDKDIYLAEVAYPHKHDGFYEKALSSDREAWERLSWMYPLSPDGQATFMSDVIEIVQSSSHGKGIFYWAPEWISVPKPGFEDEGDAPPCWARALFDEAGNALPAFSVFSQASSMLIERSIRTRTHESLNVTIEVTG